MSTARRPSYAHGPSNVPLLGETIGRCFDRVAETFPDSDALISVAQDVRYTYRELREIVDHAARALIRLGVERGDRVAIWSPNNYEWVVCQYATAKIGAILVTINPAYRAHEFEYVLRKSRARMLVLVPAFRSHDAVHTFYAVCPEAKQCAAGQIDSWRFPQLRDVVLIGSQEHPGIFTRRSFVALGDECPATALETRAAELDLDDAINIQYTSGTTGFPKGVTLSHNNILNNAFFCGESMRLTEEDRVCVPVPFFHCFGMVLGNLAVMTHGSAVVIPGASFDADATLHAVATERCTALHAVPAMLVAMLECDALKTCDLSTLRTGITGGAPCPPDIMRRVNDELHLSEQLSAYGQTEAGPVTCMTMVYTPIARRADSVGTVAPHQEIKIVDLATGRTAPRGEDGEICTRGYNTMLRYDDDPESTRETIDELGWLHSGDVGTMDEEGFVRITGRIKEMVIRGGENLYPREIEEFLLTLAPVADVAVVGVPDERYGEELLACVVPRDRDAAPNAEEFRESCRGHIAHFKIPRHWLIVDALPRTASGKIQKFRLREHALRELGLAQDLPDAAAAPAAEPTLEAAP